jgi:chaperonin GroEL
VRCARQDATSVAGLLITTEAVVAELQKKEPAHAPMHGAAGFTALIPVRPDF